MTDNNYKPPSNKEWREQVKEIKRLERNILKPKKPLARGTRESGTHPQKRASDEPVAALPPNPEIPATSGFKELREFEKEISMMRYPLEGVYFLRVDGDEMYEVGYGKPFIEKALAQKEQVGYKKGYQSNRYKDKTEIKRLKQELADAGKIIKTQNKIDLEMMNQARQEGFQDAKEAQAWVSIEESVKQAREESYEQAVAFLEDKHERDIEEAYAEVNDSRSVICGLENDKARLTEHIKEMENHLRVVIGQRDRKARDYAWQQLKDTEAERDAFKADLKRCCKDRKKYLDERNRLAERVKVLENQRIQSGYFYQESEEEMRELIKDLKAELAKASVTSAELKSENARLNKAVDSSLFLKKKNAGEKEWEKARQSYVDLIQERGNRLAFRQKQVEWLAKRLAERSSIYKDIHVTMTKTKWIKASEEAVSKAGFPKTKGVLGAGRIGH